jgi:hypothetical protein
MPGSRDEAGSVANYALSTEPYFGTASDGRRIRLGLYASSGLRRWLIIPTEPNTFRLGERPPKLIFGDVYAEWGPSGLQHQTFTLTYARIDLEQRVITLSSRPLA